MALTLPGWRRLESRMPRRTGTAGAAVGRVSLGSIRARLARLSEADLVQLRQYEERHGARPDVLSMRPTG